MEKKMQTYEILRKTEEKKQNTNKELDAVKMSQDLVRFKSVTPDETKSLDYLFDILEGMGFYCEIIRCFDENDNYSFPVNNLFAIKGDKKPSLAFCGHTDVVPEGHGWSVPAFDGVIKDDKLWGRGVEDMKGEIACFIDALSKTKDTNDYGCVCFLITGAEETMSHNGIYMLCNYLREKKNLNFDACLTGEPTGIEKLGDTYKPGRRGNVDMYLNYKRQASVFDVIDSIKALVDEKYDDGYEDFPQTDCVPVGAKAGVLFRQNKSSSSYDLKAESSFVSLELIGKQGHSGYKYKANNPIEHLLEVCYLLDDDEDIEISGFESGFIAVNVIPSNASISLVVWGDNPDKKVSKILDDYRKKKEIKYKISVLSAVLFEDLEPKASINYRFNPSYNSQTLAQEIQKRINSKNLDKKTEVDIKGVCESYLSEDDNLINNIKKSVFDILGYEPKPSVGGGTSDTRHIFSQNLAKSVADIGFVSKTLHKPDENVPIKDIKDLVKIYQKVIENFFKMN